MIGKIQKHENHENLLFFQIMTLVSHWKSLKDRGLKHWICNVWLSPSPQITVDLKHSDILYEVLRSCNLRHNSSFILFHTSSMYRDILFHSRTISFEIHYSTW